MIEIKIKGDNVTIKKQGTIKELSNDYLKLVLAIIESFSGDRHIPRAYCLEFFYRSIRKIFENEKTIIKEGD